MSVEVATLRFKVNFGTERCGNCDGLHAGPGVIATCYQVGQCHYSNFKDGEVSPRHLRIIESLSGPPKRT